MRTLNGLGVQYDSTRYLDKATG